MRYWVQWDAVAVAAALGHPAFDGQSEGDRWRTMHMLRVIERACNDFDWEL